MSAGTGVDPGAPNLNLTSEEKRVYGQLFRHADGDGVGVVTGEVAVKFFEKTRLDSRILGEIWQIADKENRGFLTPAGFGIVLRLIGHAQAGREPTPDLALQQGPIPRFDGIWPPQSPSQPPIQPQSSGGGGGGAIRIPALTPDKVAQYSSLFERQNLQGGLLPGEQARSIFDKSGLPNEALGRIWGLADTDQRGALTLPEFIIAMHLLTSTKTGSLRALPNALPPGLFEAASRTPSAAAPRQSPTSTGIPPSGIPRQLSGSAVQRNGSPLGRPPLVAQVSGPNPSTGSSSSNNNINVNNININNNNNNNNNNNEWLITPSEKAKFDQIFEGFDKANRGFITGEEAVPFLSQSRLPEDTLAQIWDLADFDSHGRLSRDGFAVAMYLILQQRHNKGPLPATLPQALIPPHRRSSGGQPRPATAISSAFEPPPSAMAPGIPAPAPKSALDDLFGLDSSSSSAMAPTQTTMSTGGSNVNDPFGGGGGSHALRPSSPLSKSASPNPGSFKPFVPASSFGRGLTGQPMGGDSAAQRSLSEDLLSDNDEAGKKISEDATELANLSNQIGSLTKQTQELESKRATTQLELNQTNSQKQNFEQRLAQLRQLYEKEAQDTRSLEDRLRTSRADTQKLRGDCMTLESQLSDVKGQHEQVFSALQADQRENARLRDRIRAVQGEISQLKPLIEKHKMEARQQKGLVAINKKQLSTTEGERDKLRSEADSLAMGVVVDDIILSRQAETGSPASASAQLASPSPSGSSGGNNPFFKRTSSADILSAFGAQPARTAFDKSSFDDLFGPAGPTTTSGSSGTPPPVFRQQHTGQSSASVGSYSNISASSPNVTRQAPQSANEPASSEPRQLTSVNLPFPEHNNESLSSSTQVSPPHSRAEGSGAGSFPFPGGMVTTNAEAGKAPAPAVNSGDDVERGDSVGAATVPAAPGGGVGGGGGGGGSGSPQRPAESDFPTAHHGSAPFDSTDNAKAKEDFDNAFAAFASSKSPMLSAADAAKPLATFDAEFPPISELEREDSDSASEGGGFDDDFAPASPAPRTNDPKLAASTSTPEPHHAEMTAVSNPEPTLDGKSPELPASPATITRGNAAAISQGSNVDDIFGSGTLTVSGHRAGGGAQAKGAFDDLDDDFEGLEDAKEGSADDDFANISRSGLDEYNPMFDSSPPASQAKTSGPAGPGSQQRGPEPHDWDAIFAGLDAPGGNPAPPAPNNNSNNPNGNSNSNSNNDNDNDDTTNPNSLVGAAEDEGTDPRPNAPGRALTEGGDHDDPLLKSLTSMGYPRPAALEALEKFDYNLEKAANFLAGQS